MGCTLAVYEIPAPDVSSPPPEVSFSVVAPEVSFSVVPPEVSLPEVTPEVSLPEVTPEVSLPEVAPEVSLFAPDSSSSEQPTNANTTKHNANTFLIRERFD